MANEYFTLMNKARKKGLDSFIYNDTMYVASKTKTGLVVYKKKPHAKTYTAKLSKTKK